MEEEVTSTTSHKLGRMLIVCVLDSSRLFNDRFYPLLRADAK